MAARVAVSPKIGSLGQAQRACAELKLDLRTNGLPAREKKE